MACAHANFLGMNSLKILKCTFSPNKLFEYFKLCCRPNYYYHIYLGSVIEFSADIIFLFNISPR